MKKLLVALFIACLWTPANASGTIPLSMTQQLDSSGKPLIGGKLYFYEAGTVATPQNAYQDSALSIALPNPITLDAAARVPQLFLADGTIKIRLTDKDGNTILVADNVQVIGASSGDGGGGTVDATTVFTTGDIKAVYGTGSISGWVRMNGRTIGSATSGATERANADTEALFVYLWGADSNLTVSGGRGSSAASDWAANKTITLPDARGRVVAALPAMGATDSERITSTYCDDTPALGIACGSQTITIAQTNLPNVNFAVDIPSGQGSHPHDYTGPSTTSAPEWGLGDVVSSQWSGTATKQTQNATLPAMTGTAASGGSGTALTNLPPTILATMYIKL